MVPLLWVENLCPWDAFCRTAPGCSSWFKTCKLLRFIFDSYDIHTYQQTHVINWCIGIVRIDKWCHTRIYISVSSFKRYPTGLSNVNISYFLGICRRFRGYPNNLRVVRDKFLYRFLESCLSKQYQSTRFTGFFLLPIWRTHCDLNINWNVAFEKFPVHEYNVCYTSVSSEITHK